MVFLALLKSKFAFNCDMHNQSLQGKKNIVTKETFSYFLFFECYIVSVFKLRSSAICERKETLN